LTRAIPKAPPSWRELVKKVDVLVENFCAGTIARLGFGYPEVRQPQSADRDVFRFHLRQTGPLATDPGFD